jgi:predicted transcriptional regulator
MNMSKETTQKEQTIEEMIAEMQALEQESLALHTLADAVRERIRERLASLDVSLGGAVKRTRRAAPKERKVGTTADVLAFAAGQDEFAVDGMAKAVGVAVQQGRNALTGLCKRGLVERFERGRYRITDAGKKVFVEKTAE